jgi:hypothetical protein
METSRKKEKKFLQAGVVLALLLASVFGSACTTEERNLISPEESNVLLLGAFAGKNVECGVQRAYTLPLVFDADRRSVGLCASAILAATCAEWSSTSFQAPTACLGVLIQL